MLRESRDGNIVRSHAGRAAGSVVQFQKGFPPVLSDMKLRRFDRRRLSTVGGVFIVLLLLGAAAMMLRPGASSSPFYTPGVTPSREDCVLAKMKTYAKLNKQTLANIATECELTVQSIEGHEVLRKAWEAREAARAAEPKAPAPEPATAEPAEKDRLRRVWN